MSQETEQTIGQEFAALWMSKRNPAQFNTASLLRDLVEAVDGFVNSEPEGMRSLIRELALAADGDESALREATTKGETIRITARQFLRYPGLVAVANKHHLSGPQTWQFPV